MKNFRCVCDCLTDNQIGAYNKRIAIKPISAEELARLMYGFNDDSWRLLDEHSKNNIRNTAAAILEKYRVERR